VKSNVCSVRAKVSAESTGIIAIEWITVDSFPGGMKDRIAREDLDADVHPRAPPIEPSSGDDRASQQLLAATRVVHQDSLTDLERLILFSRHRNKRLTNGAIGPAMFGRLTSLEPEGLAIEDCGPRSINLNNSSQRETSKRQGSYRVRLRVGLCSGVSASPECATRTISGPDTVDEAG
jgi:hypothetical protein